MSMLDRLAGWFGYVLSGWRDSMFETAYFVVTPAPRSPYGPFRSQRDAERFAAEQLDDYRYYTDGQCRIFGLSQMGPKEGTTGYVPRPRAGKTRYVAAAGVPGTERAVIHTVSEESWRALKRDHRRLAGGVLAVRFSELDEATQAEILAALSR